MARRGGLRSSSISAMEGGEDRPKPRLKLRDKARALRVPADSALQIDAAGVIHSDIPSIPASPVSNPKRKFSVKQFEKILRSPPNREVLMLPTNVTETDAAIEPLDAAAVDDEDPNILEEETNPTSEGSSDPSWCKEDVPPDAQDPEDFADDANNTPVLVDNVVPDSLPGNRITRAEIARSMAISACAPSGLESGLPPTGRHCPQQNAGATVTATMEKTARQLVDQDHVAKLVRDYWRHFGEYSKGKKRAVLQLIPKKVWELVYSDYKKQFPNSTFMPGSLKDHLRDSLRDLKSGVNNPEDGQTATAQDPLLMRQLMNTDSWKARNVLRLRQDVMQGVPRPPSSEPPSNIPTDPRSSTPLVPPSPSHSPGDPSRPQTPSTGRTSQLEEQPPEKPADSTRRGGKPTTKAENLKRAREDISDMVSAFKTMREDRVGGASTSRLAQESANLVAVARASDFEAKREETQLRSAYQASQNKMAEIALLKEQKALGLISEDAFTEGCKAVFGLK